MTNEEHIKNLETIGYDGWTVTEEAYKSLQYAITVLEREPCEDAVSRQAVLEKMSDYVASGYAESVKDFEEYSKIICQLPSVTLLRRKDGLQEIAKLKRENASLKANRDKIRAEIDKARYIDKDTRICKNALARGLEAAMQIIDKYKEEGEG